MARKKAVHSRIVLSEPLLSELVNEISLRTAVDFHQYKKSFLQRQIVRHMHKYVSGCEKEDTASSWAHFCSPREIVSNLTVNVTSFFRDTSLFEFLMQQIFPVLWSQHQRTAGSEFRIWIMGCSTGEEAYSVAMAFLESVQPNLSSQLIRIFATDLDETVVDRARRGEYDPGALASLGRNLRTKYFLPGPKPRIVPEVRRLIAFGQHDMLKDPFIRHLDMIFCRNIFIFLDKTAQRQVFRKILLSLKRNGVVVLGKSESPARDFARSEVVPLCTHNRVYQKTAWNGIARRGKTIREATP